jgi:hypothetical protein
VTFVRGLVFRQPRGLSDAWLQPFRDPAQPAVDAYGDLFRYFVAGFTRRRSPHGAFADYVGWRSLNGRHCDRMEGFTRILPLIAAWLHGGRPARLRLACGTEVDLAELMREGMLAGTDPASSEYWGDIEDRDQRLVEAADVALGLWLARGPLWDMLSDVERVRIATWLRGANGRQTADNNWHLFVVLVDAVLEDLGAGADRAELTRRYNRFKVFYRGNGWFSDGPAEKFDYYAAWGIHYPLFWLAQIDPAWDADFLRAARREFLATYKCLFGPNGFPIMGRSVCYRIAAPAPLVLGQSTDPDCVTPGEARRALDLTWRYCIAHGAVRDGTVTQGYGAADPRVLDNYSGPASCLWSLRSLVAAFFLDDDTPFWRSAGEPLPVERGDFAVRIPATGWTVHGVQRTGEIRIETGSGATSEAPVLRSYPFHRRILDRLLRRAGRPDNLEAKYGRGVYSNLQPFCGLRPGSGQGEGAP